jgi:hypothetical protein
MMTRQELYELIDYPAYQAWEAEYLSLARVKDEG